ncbi:hypothetical protein [Neisseria shayeganii]|uniref:Uncharacterized protein n=1 Tax=Neisseria shayeganii TaxID=607712 RepID=A0A7D7S6M1_9NEIS|nr:hypothetical protein [Neisseria shayeganii]QMT39828.1 hypothetical protein H3L94_08100 [Neisseria shayeganii]
MLRLPEKTYYVTFLVEVALISLNLSGSPNAVKEMPTRYECVTVGWKSFAKHRYRQRIPRCALLVHLETNQVSGILPDT